MHLNLNANIWSLNLTSYEEFHVEIFNGGTWVSLHDVDRLWSGLCSWYYWWWFLLGPRLDNCGLLPPRRWRWCHRPAMGTEFLLSLLLGLSCRRVWLRLFQHHITLFHLSEIINIWKKYRTKQNNTYVAGNIVHLPFKESICHHLHSTSATGPPFSSFSLKYLIKSYSIQM